jgi:hypothetical protein
MMCALINSEVFVHAGGDELRDGDIYSCFCTFTGIDNQDNYYECRNSYKSYLTGKQGPLIEFGLRENLSDINLVVSVG